MSQRRLISLLLAAILVVISTFTATQNTSQSQTASAGTPVATSSDPYFPVVRVVDGDTIVIRRNSKDEKVRLIGLDTPEVVDPRKPVQCFGKEASAEAHKIMDGSSVRLETDESQGTYDKYGRTLAFVYVPANSTTTGIMVNKYMIENGFGHEYTYDEPYRYQREFKAAEKTAREQSRGLWANGVCAS